MTKNTPPAARSNRSLAWMIALSVVVACLAAFIGYTVLSSPRAASSYEQIEAGQSRQEVARLLGSAGSQEPPANTVGRYMPKKSQRLHERYGSVTARYWLFRDGIVVCRFNEIDLIVEKNLLLLP